MKIDTITHIGGWTSHIHHGLRDLAIMKFGENPTKKNKTSWAPTNDDLANKLLDKLVGAIHINGFQSSRLILRVIYMNELYKYITTGNVDLELIERVEKSDRMYWCDFQDRKLLNP